LHNGGSCEQMIAPHNYASVFATISRFNEMTVSCDPSCQFPYPILSGIGEDVLVREACCAPQVGAVAILQLVSAPTRSSGYQRTSARQAVVEKPGLHHENRPEPQAGIVLFCLMIPP
jgi:hypothetical protein